MKKWLIAAVLFSAAFWSVAADQAFAQAFQPPIQYAPLPALGTISLTGTGCSPVAPTVSSGFGTNPAITAPNGTCAFDVNVGTGGTATSGVIGLPKLQTGQTGWACFVSYNAAPTAAVSTTVQTASSTSSCTVGNFTDLSVSGAWTASFHFRVTAIAY